MTQRETDTVMAIESMVGDRLSDIYRLHELREIAKVTSVEECLGAVKLATILNLIPWTETVRLVKMICRDFDFDDDLASIKIEELRYL